MADSSEIARGIGKTVDTMRGVRVRSAEELLKNNPSYLPAAALPKPPMIAAREQGGPVKAGRPYLVGERGPEIVVPAEDGEVVPNKDLKKKKARKLLQAALAKK
jgi:SLT domain-containing protein